MADALFTRTQQRVLGLLFGQPDREYRLVELIELAGSGRGAVQRELQRLVESRLVSCTILNRTKTYRANTQSAIFAELHSIVVKTSGVAAILQAALSAMSDRIRFAVLFGSIAKGTDRATSDVDVLLVSDDVTLEEAYRVLAGAEQRLGRAVSPTVYTTEEFRRARRERSPFLTKVLGGPHVVLLGSEDAIASPR